MNLRTRARTLRRIHTLTEADARFHRRIDTLNVSADHDEHEAMRRLIHSMRVSYIMIRIYQLHIAQLPADKSDAMDAAIARLGLKVLDRKTYSPRDADVVAHYPLLANIQHHFGAWLRDRLHLTTYYRTSS